MHQHRREMEQTKKGNQRQTQSLIRVDLKAMATMTIYESSRCGVCRQVVPRLRRMAERRGVKVEVVNVDNCTEERCREVKAVPTVMVDGREVRDMKQLAELLK